MKLYKLNGDLIGEGSSIREIAENNKYNLFNADLSYADLSYAKLSHANLSYAKLSHTNLSHAILPHFQICPEKGQFIAFKKGRNDEIIELLIPKDAKRNSCLMSRKCRSSKAIVISITKDGKKLDSCECWNTKYDFIYKVGETVYPDSYDPDIRTNCSHGIHFFITRKEAERW
uniref:Pentapeptide repeat-containing protein n=1 Tax=viral metagenome TaxID=1070528 RepID=A0A6H1Z952_9ZZZZ